MSSSTHAAVGLTERGKLGAFQVPSKRPGPGEVLVRVQYASFGAADGHAVYDNFFVSDYPQVVGLVAAGPIQEVGEGANDFQVGDLVGVFCQPGSDRGHQEYVVAPANRVTKIPPGVTQEDVAAIIDNFVCGWWTISSSLQLPLPDLSGGKAMDSSKTALPILIWGGGTSAAVFTIQILRLAGYTNVIATTSPRTAAAATTYGASHVIDYNDPNVAEKILSAAGGVPIKYALDPVATAQSLASIAKVVTEPGSRVALLLPVKVGDFASLTEGKGELLRELPKENNPFNEGVDVVGTATFAWEGNAELKSTLLNKTLPYLLYSGEIQAQEVFLIDEGTPLERVEKAANLHRTGKIGGKKVVIDFRTWA